VTQQPEEVFETYQSPAGAQVTHCRGTLIVSSLDALRRHGHYESYLQLLPEAFREELVHTLPASWVPVALAQEHYIACNALRLSTHAMDAIASDVTERVSATFLATFLRTARSVGANPWHALKQSHLLVPRVLQGGSIRIIKVGPKDARIETRGLSLFHIPYFSRAFCTFVKRAALVFTETAYARQLETTELNAHVALLSWV